ncbi:hypothetical protein T08_15652, partial [Trichinella sp. T8]
LCPRTTLGIEYAAYLPDFGITCVLDKQQVSTETLRNYKMKMLPNLSVQECIMLCNTLSKPNCIAIKHSLEGSVCYTFSNKRNVTEKNYGPYVLTYLNECVRGSYFLNEIKNDTIINTRVFLIPFDVQEEEATYIVENRATVESVWSKVIAISKNESLLSCLIHCNEQSRNKGCKAVIYNPVAKKCTLLKRELKINSVFITTTHNIEHLGTGQAERTSTEGFVQLYRYLELCKINVIHNGKIENVTSIRLILNVRSVNKCLHFCRSVLHQHSYCAIVYSKKKYKCELLKKDTERSSAYFADAEKNLVELLECYPDRQDERRNNPPPVRYYLKEIGEVCVVEFYNVTDLNDFNSFESLENVENIKSCIYFCRLKHETHLCLAINYTVKKQCILFQRQMTPVFYIVEPQSLFAEILFCEQGTHENLRTKMTLPHFPNWVPKYFRNSRDNNNYRIRKNDHTVLFSDCATYATLELFYIKACKSILFAVYLEDSQMTCILDKQKVSRSKLHLYDMQMAKVKSFDECVLLCYSLRPEKKCDAIKYFHTSMKCYVFATHINATALKTRNNSLQITYVYECTKGSHYLREIRNHSKLVSAGTFISLQLDILDIMFIIERRPAKDSIYSKIIINVQKESIVACISFCYAMLTKVGCNAILYNTAFGWCTLLKYEKPILPVTLERHESRMMFILHLTLPKDVKVNSVVIKVTHNISYELCAESRARVDKEDMIYLRIEEEGRTITSAYVHLHRHFEICKINIIHNGKIENVTSIRMIPHVRSTNKCLHFCRPILRQLSYCAIVYSKKDYKCQLLKRDTEGRGTYSVDDEKNVIELLRCYSDRLYERRKNPPPVRFYLKEVGEICVLEFYNATQISSFNAIEILENIENIKSCIYVCRKRFHRDLCLAISYNKKKQCTLLRKASYIRLYNVEPQSLFAEILFCEQGTLMILALNHSQILSLKNNVHHLGIRKMFAQNFFLIAILMQLWQCKSIPFALYVKEVQMTCVLDQLKVSNSTLRLYEMRKVWSKSFDECILMCNLLLPENKCNAIKYSQNLMKCYLLVGHIISKPTETQNESHDVTFVYGCSEGSHYLHEVENYSELVLGGTFVSLQTEILNKTFIIEKRPTVDSINSKIIETVQKEFIADCIATCYVKSWQTGCNAVIYNPKASLCTLLKHGTPTPPITFTHHGMILMFLLHLILPRDVKVNSIVIEATHNISYELRAECCAAVAPCELKILQLDSKRISGPSVEQAERISKESYVHLYRYLELCKVNIIHNRKIENVTSVQIISNVRSVNRCLHFCRPWLRYLSYCSIIYSRHNYKCELLKRNAQGSNVRSINRRSNLVELLNCRAERQNQRKHNPPPVRYYLQKTGEICVLEFYNTTQLSGFNPTETFENVENIKSCIYACRIRYTSYICLAIKYTMKKQCTLLRQEMNHEIYNVESQSLFAEILFCEPGTLEKEKMFALYCFMIGILTQLLQCRGILFSAYLNNFHMTCELDKRKVSTSSLQSYKMHTVLGKSFEECIIICNLLRPEKKCSAIKYFQTIMKCYLFAMHINSTTPETRYDTLNVIHINGCKKGSLYLREFGNHSMLAFGGTFISLQMEILNRTFIIERRPTVDSIRSKIILNEQKESISSCFSSCYFISRQIGCNAVIYNPRTNLCTLLKHATPSPPVSFAVHKDRLMFLLHLTLPWDVEVNSILIPAIHNMSYELCAQSRARAKNASNAFQRNNTLDELLEMESTEEENRIATGYVHLYRYMELCKINIVYSRKIENVKKIRTILNIRSVNKCMHYCQPFVRQSTYCAVEYSKDNYKCVLLLSSRTKNAYFVGIDKHLIEVLECHPDRQDERRNNFPPLRFYFAETSEICVLEFHRSSLLSGFLLTETFQNVEHIKSCIWTCRHRHYSYLCIAINYTMNKECNLFIKQWNATMYAVKPGSIFAEILLCEPGTLVDEILDF